MSVILCNIISIYFQEFKEKSTNGLENVILKEVESGNLVNDNVLKLLPIQKPKIKNADSCYLRHFENFDSIYVSKVEDSQILVDTIQSTGWYYNITHCDLQS